MGYENFLKSGLLYKGLSFSASWLYGPAELLMRFDFILNHGPNVYVCSCSFHCFIMGESMVDVLGLETKNVGEEWGKRRTFFKPELRMHGVALFLFNDEFLAKMWFDWGGREKVELGV